MICSYCGEMVGEGEYTIIDGEVYCNQCRDDLGYVKCEDCGKWYKKYQEGYYLSNYDRNVCDGCIENYAWCDNCQEYVEQDEINYVDCCDRYICDDCLENSGDFQRCDDCGEWLDDDHTYCDESGTPYCESCYYDRYTTCDACDCELRRDEAYESEDGDILCSDCYNERHPQIIHSYHDSSVEYEKLFTDDERHLFMDLQYFGIELEVSGDTYYAEEFLEIVGEDKVVLMKDSSIDGGGFEIISMPMTKKYFYDEFMPAFSEGLAFLREHGFKSHNHGGMHVHVSEIQDGKQLANLCKVLYGDIDDRNMWLAITQRRGENMQRWSSMINIIYSTQQIIENYSEYDSTYKAPAGCGNRYTAINYDSRTGTHEFRIFNGNIRTERFLKNMETVFALLDYTKDLNNVMCNTKGFLKFVKMNEEDYPELNKFIEEKEIINNTYFPESDVEMYEAA